MLIGVDFSNARRSRRASSSRGTSAAPMVADTASGARPAEILDTIARVVGALSDHPDAVGIAIPGEVNTDGRCWRLPNTRGFEGVRIAEEVSRRLRCPIAVENRATTAALAEQLYGHGQQHETFLLVSLETGIGGGLVDRTSALSRVQRFWRGNRPYLRGHFAGRAAVRVRTTRLRGGVRGHARRAAQVRRARRQSHGAERGRRGRARRAEWIGVMAFETMGRALGRALGTVQNFLDLGAVVFAGAAALHFDLIEPYVREELRLKAFAPPLAEVPLLTSELGESAGVIGAAHLTTL